MSGSLPPLRSLGRMRRRRLISSAVAGSALLTLLVTASLAHAAPAVDQYSEGIPTATGQKPDRDAAQGGAPVTIPPATQAKLSKTKKGVAAGTLAQLTAPNRSKPGAASADGADDGLGLVLPIILAMTLLVALAIFVARRRLGASAS
jgi:hypothetical protein